MSLETKKISDPLWCPNCGRALFKNGEFIYITNSLHLSGRCNDALREEFHQSNTKSYILSGR